jgi:hypothetical protein
VPRRFAPAVDNTVWTVIETRKPLLIKVIDDAYLATMAVDAAHLLLLRKLAPRSHVRVPVVCNDRVRGVLTLIKSRAGVRYRAADLKRTVDLATRISPWFADLVDELPGARSRKPRRR